MAQINGPYCSHRNKGHTRCTGPIVAKRTKTRVRRGRVETFVYLLCAQHDAVATGPSEPYNG